MAWRLGDSGVGVLFWHGSKVTVETVLLWHGG